MECPPKPAETMDQESQLAEMNAYFRRQESVMEQLKASLLHLNTEIRSAKSDPISHENLSLIVSRCAEMFQSEIESNASALKTFASRVQALEDRLDTFLSTQKPVQSTEKTVKEATTTMKIDHDNISTAATRTSSYVHVHAIESSDEFSGAEFSDDSTEQKQLNLNLIITGLHETRATPEGVIDLFKYRMGADVDESDLINVHILGSRSHHPVTMVTFRSFATRQKVYKRRTALRHTKGIWVNEVLTTARRRLNYQARALYRAKKIYKNWTFCGNIFIKVTDDGPILRIDNKDSLLAASHLPDNHRFEARVMPSKNDDFTREPRKLIDSE